MRPVLLVLACMAVTCAPPARAEPADPLEQVNRRVHAFNRLAQVHALGPAAELYRAQVPAPVRQGIGQALANLREPVVAASALAAGDVTAARTAATRFGINTVLGWGGVRDRAAEMGHAPRAFTPADALCAWGVPAGPFLVLPLLGPTNVRDAIGDGVDSLGNPVGLATGYAFTPLASQLIGAGRGALGGLTLRADNIETLDALRAESLDYYARLRSVVQQRRDAQLGRTSERGGGLITLDDPGAGPAAPLPGITAPGPAERALGAAHPATIEINRAWATDVLRRADPGATGR